MIKEVNGKKYILMEQCNYACRECVGWKNADLCASLHEYCDDRYFSEAEDQTPGVTNNQEEPTLRDQFAMAIVSGKIYCFRSGAQDEQDDYARRVYTLADAMMKARTK